MILSKPSIAKSSLGIIFSVALLSTTLTPSHSQLSSSCEFNCVPLFFRAISAGLSTLVTPLTVELGRAAQQWVEVIALDTENVATTISEISRIKVSENHLLEEKVETFELKANINDTFGAKASDLSMATNISDSSALDTQFSQIQEASFIGNEILANIRGAGQRTTTTHNLLDETVMLVDDFSNGVPLDPNENDSLAVISQLLSQHRWFPAPNLDSLDDTDREYARIYLDRKYKLGIVKNVIDKTIAQRAGVINDPSAIAFYNALLFEAGTPNTTGLMSEHLAVRALAVSHFGSAYADRVSSLFGDELRRKHSHHMSINLFLQSKIQEEYKDISTLVALNNASETDSYFSPDLIESINR